MSYVVGDDGRGEFKYGIESALMVGCTYSATMTVGALYDPKQLERVPDGCHIYAICTRPRLLLASAEVLDEGEHSSTYAFSVATSDGLVSAHIECQIPAPPHTTLTIAGNGANALFMSSEGELVAGAPIALLLSAVMPHPFDETRPEEIDREMLDLSVEYIGQAYGKDGSRDALDRLARHETLQKILGELNDQGPHRQVWIALFRFNVHTAASVFGPWEGTASGEEAISNMVGIQSVVLPGDQLTTLAEGSLIRYFRPPFNDRYKDTFPAPEHSSYEIPYKLDANAVGFDLETTNIGVRFGSSSVTPQWSHGGLYALSDPSVRRAFMDVFQDPPAFLYPLFNEHTKD